MIKKTNVSHTIRTFVKRLKCGNHRFFENNLPHKDNQFRTLTKVKLGLGTTATFAGMSLSGDPISNTATLGALWLCLTAGRKIMVDQKTEDPKLKWYDKIRKKKLADDIFVSGLSSIPMVFAKAYLSNGLTTYLDAGPVFNIAMDIALLSLVGGSMNYIQRISRDYPDNVVHKDMFRSFVAITGAYGLFGIMYTLGITDRMMFSAATVAITRKVIGEGWAAYSELPENTKTKN